MNTQAWEKGYCVGKDDTIPNENPYLFNTDLWFEWKAGYNAGVEDRNIYSKG
jgi:hypothetical protein